LLLAFAAHTPVKGNEVTGVDEIKQAEFAERLLVHGAEF